MLSACGPVSDKNVIFDHFETHEVEIVSVNSPKHFSVTVKDRDIGVVFSNTARSKHCYNWRATTTIGARYTVPVRVYLNTLTGERTYSLMSDHLNEQLC